MADKVYRTFIGIVQWDPRDGEAAGKKVRNATIRATGVKEQSALVSLTLWPSHAATVIAQGDVVVAEGVFTRATAEDGQKVYNNLSVSRLLKLGAADQGVREARAAAADEPEEDDPDDDIPY